MQQLLDGSAVTSAFRGRKMALRHGLVSGLLLSSMVGLSASAQAAIKTWDGGGSTNNFSDGLNWTDDQPPAANDSLVFAGTNKLAPVNDFPLGTQFNGISFDASAGAFVLSGNGINLGSDLADASTAAQTISFPLVLLQNTNASVVPINGTLTLSSDVTEDATPRTFTKLGAGTLVLAGRNTFSAGLNINAGVISLAAASTNGQQGAGTGTITFNNTSTLTLNGFTGSTTPTYGNLANALVVPAGAVARINTSQRGSVSSTLTGAGTLTINTAYVRSDFTANFTAFTGVINITGSDFRLLNNTVFGANNIVNIGVGGNPYQTFNPPNSGTLSTVQTIGELSGVQGAFIGGNPVAGRFANFTVGARNTSSTFEGIIRNNPNGTSLTKVGTGTLTLTGANTYTGITSVTGGAIAGTGALGGGATFAINTTHAPGLGTIPTGTQPVNGPYILNDGSTLRIGSQNVQVAVVGTVTLGTTTGTLPNLVVTSGFSSSAGQKFTIINNDAADAVVGTFAGLAEGAQLTSTDGTVFTISYIGGDGNDVVLTVVTPGSATGSPGSFGIISEFRTSGPNGINDEFIEIYNNSEALLDLNGYSVVAGGVTIPIPAGRVLPVRGRLLLTNSTATTGYSLAAIAAGDITFTGDIADGSTVALKNAAGVTVDQVNATSLPAPVATTDNYSYVRRMDGAGGIPLDTATGANSNDLNDFNTVDVASLVGPNTTTGISNGIQRLGAPGPENLASPITNNGLVTLTPATAVPATNRVGAGNMGTLGLRYVLANRATSGRTLTSLRFRVVAITAGTSNPANPTGAAFNGPADLRLISSTSSDGTILPLLLQAPAQANGGGLNSTVSLANLPGGGLAPGQSVTVEFLFNVVQRGSYRILINLEPATISNP